MKGCMKLILSNNLKSLVFLGILLATISLNACSKNSQTVQMLEAAPVTCELYGTCTKSFSLVIDQVDSISWAALDWSGEYKYFEVTQITIGQKTYEGDGSTHVFEKLTLSKSNVVTVTYTYSPLTAQEDVETPHHATLKLVGASPQLATIQVDLTGYVQGVCDDETEDCRTVDASGYAPIQYELTDTMTIYVCHPDLAEYDNDDERDNTRKDSISITDPFIFYRDSDDIYHIARDSINDVDPSIPDFEAPVPAGALPINLEALPVAMSDLQDIECESSSDGIECKDIKIELNGGFIEVLFLATTGTITPSTDQCESFGSLAGSGNIGNDEIKVVGWAEVPDIGVDIFTNALIVVEVSLTIIK